MQVQVRLFATFRIGRFTEQVRDYLRGHGPAGTGGSWHHPSQVGTVFLDSKFAELDHELHENARLGIFPMVGGG